MVVQAGQGREVTELASSPAFSQAWGQSAAGARCWGKVGDDERDMQQR